ncbi:MAG: EFR1 family ferrodoxin [Clostridia bacterium]
MGTEIYCFSGTGNSLHVARELQKRLPETNLIPMASLINKDALETKAETVGFVFPIHLATVPMLVQDIIKKLDLSSAKYIFAIVTRAGTPCSTSFTKMGKIWKKKAPCFLCYACINYCPMQSIQIKSKKYMKIYTEKNGRYHHPDATVDDISAQK